MAITGSFKITDLAMYFSAQLYGAGEWLYYKVLGVVWDSFLDQISEKAGSLGIDLFVLRNSVCEVTIGPQTVRIAPRRNNGNVTTIEFVGDKEAVERILTAFHWFVISLDRDAVMRKAVGAN